MCLSTSSPPETPKPSAPAAAPATSVKPSLRTNLSRNIAQGKNKKSTGKRRYRVNLNNRTNLQKPVDLVIRT